MNRKIVLTTALILVLIGVLGVAFKVQMVEAKIDYVYIRLMGVSIRHLHQYLVWIT